MTAFIRRSDLSRDRSEQRPERFSVGDKIDAKVTQIDKGSRRVSVSIKALEISDEQEAVKQYGSADSGASLGDILGAALARTDDGEAEEKPKAKAKAKQADDKTTETADEAETKSDEVETADADAAEAEAEEAPKKKPAAKKTASKAKAKKDDDAE